MCRDSAASRPVGGYVLGCVGTSGGIAVGQGPRKKIAPLALVNEAPAKPWSGVRVGGTDELFAAPRQLAQDFEFGSTTAAVFDDMVSRSVPFYDEIQRMVCELAADFAAPGSALYDMGCATGTTLRQLDSLVDPNVLFVGIDNSRDMLDQARSKLENLDSGRKIELIEADLNEFQSADNASVIVMILTLQFVRPLHRERVIKRCYESLRKNGALILVEKIIGSHGLLNRLFIEHYYDYKRRNGYSDLEISQKREALENVLIPYKFEENRDLLLGTGFQHVEEFFRWYNFCAIVAVK
jgi:tRNA (cmo5U34)-methyltransferase